MESYAQPQLPDPPTQNQNDNHLFERVSKRKLNVLERGANLWREMKKSMKRKKYVSKKIGGNLITMVLMHAPKIGLESASTIMALFGAALMVDLGVEGYQIIPNITPCKKTLCKFLFEGAVDSLLLERDIM